MNLFKRRRLGNSLSAVLNILGMTAAFAALYIILVQVHHDLSYNRGIKDAERIYIVSVPDWYTEGKYLAWVSRPPFEHMISACSGIEAGGVGYLRGDPINLIVGKDGAEPQATDPGVEIKASSLNPDAAQALGMELVSGSWDELRNGSTFAVSESAARRFGLQPGSSAILDYGAGTIRRISVVAVYKDAPRNTDLDSFDIFSAIGDECIDDWNEWSYNYFVKAAPGVSREQLEKEGGDAVCEFVLEGETVSDEERKEIEESYALHLVPLTESYFDETVNHAPGATGTRSTTMTLLAVAILVIVIAFINFINFFFALVPLRIHSVNTRKVLGASRASLIMDNVLDALLMVVVSLVFAAAVVLLFAGSPLASLISCPVGFGSNPGVALFTVGLGLVLSVVASLYPAFYITSFSPALALKGSFGASGKGRTFRYILVGLQFLISISLIICASFVSLQRSYMLHHDMGFDRECLLSARVTNAAAKSAATVESRLLENPQIKAVTWGDGNVVRESRMGWGRTFKGEQISFQCYPVSWNFLQVMGIPVVEGRDFTRADEQCENGVFIFNEAAKRQFGLSLEDKMQGHTDTATDIVGFCRDFNFRSLRSDITPFCFYIFGKNPWRNCRTLIVRTEKNSDIGALRSYIASVVSEVDPSVSSDAIDVQLFSDQVQSQYESESNLSTLITLFSVLAIIISLMGVFGLVMFETEHRRKEIGVRRVNGASVAEILRMFCAEFVRIVLICFVLATPLSWLTVSRYLEGFAYKVPIYPWVFALALLLTLAITVAVVIARSWRAATENPSLTLKRE